MKIYGTMPRLLDRLKARFPILRKQVEGERTITLRTGQEITLPRGFTPAEARAAEEWANELARGVAEFLGVSPERVKIPRGAAEEFIRGYREAFVAGSPTPKQARTMAKIPTRNFAQAIKSSD